MSITKHIPNFLTCMNLLCGCIGILAVFDGHITHASYLIFLACVFDFLDGFVARLLKVTSGIGKELDSLADMTTFGVLPAFILFSLISGSLHTNEYAHLANKQYFPFIAFAIAIFSALRLAKFNIDTRQSDSFIGVPTPANGILIGSLPLISTEISMYSSIISNPYILISLAVIMSFLLVSPIKLIALKFKDFSWASNKMRYILILSSIVLLAILKFPSIPIIIFLYVFLSIVDNNLNSRKTVLS